MSFAEKDKNLTPDRAREELIGLYKVYAVDHLIKKKLAPLLYKTNLDPKFKNLNKSLEEFLKNKQHQEAYDLMATFLFSVEGDEIIKKDDKSKNIERLTEIIKMVECLEAENNPLQSLHKFNERFYATTYLFLKDDKEAEHPAKTKREFFERGPQEKYHIYHKAHEILNSTPLYQDNIDSLLAKLKGRLVLTPSGKEHMLIQSMLQFLEHIKKGDKGKDMEVRYAEIQFIIHSIIEKDKQSLSFITNEIFLEARHYVFSHKILDVKKVDQYFTDLKFYDPRAPDVKGNTAEEFLQPFKK